MGRGLAATMARVRFKFYSMNAQGRVDYFSCADRDSANEFVAAYSPSLNTCYVIRPDGYVGYHERLMTEHGAFAHLAAWQEPKKVDR